MRCARCGALQPLAMEQRDKPGASSPKQSTNEKLRGDVKRAGAVCEISERCSKVRVFLQESTTGRTETTR